MSAEFVPPPPPPPVPKPPDLNIVPQQLTKIPCVSQLRSREDIKNIFNERLRKILSTKDGSKVIVSMNKEVDSILQEGPCCGLVALAMASQLFGLTLTIEEVFSAARNKGFTKQGEIFSAIDMKHLVEDVVKNTSVTLIDVSNTSDVLIDSLAIGDVCLIPYDADFNHEPCNKKGHKAHWALLSGCGLILDSTVCCIKGLEAENGIVTGVPELPGDLINNAEEVLVYGLQGKSQFPGVWTLSSLVASNRNLVEVDPARQIDDIGFVLPEEGIETALCSKALILSPKK